MLNRTGFVVTYTPFLTAVTGIFWKVCNHFFPEKNLSLLEMM